MKTIKNTLYIIKILWNTSKSAFFVQFLYAIVSAAFLPISVLFNKFLIDLLTDGRDFKNIIYIMIILIISEVFISIIDAVLGYFWNPRVMWIFIRRMNHDLMKKSIALDLACYDDSEFYNKYTRALAEADNRASNVFDQTFSLITAVMRFLAVITILLALDPIIILFTVFSIAIGFVFNKSIKKLSYQNDIATTNARRSQYYVKGRVIYQPEFAKELRMNSGIFNILTRKYENAIKEILENIKIFGARYCVRKIPHIILDAIISFSKTLYMVWCVFVGRFTLGTFVALQNSSQEFQNAVGTITNSTVEFYQSSLFINNYLEIMNYPSKICGREGKELEGKNIEVEVSNVSFAYKKDYPILKNISMRINAGEHVAIVGLNGSGKSTLVKLLVSLYNPDSGNIKFNGCDIIDYSSKSIYDSISTVFQDFNIFALSVAENVAKTEDIDYERLDDSLRCSGMSEKINSLDKGVDTVLSTEFGGGINLSGGEAQKIAIASAIYKSSKMLIFDEPTSALDPLMEKEIFDRIDTLFREHTTILISHRLANVIRCDKIFYMSEGTITESGTHDELMRLNGDYAKLFKIQAKEYQMSDVC